jgi:hypothetical protein
MMLFNKWNNRILLKDKEFLAKILKILYFKIPKIIIKNNKKINSLINNLFINFNIRNIIIILPVFQIDLFNFNHKTLPESI